MANNLTDNPMILDTAGGGVLTSARIQPAKIRWDGATTAGHTLLIKDSAGIVKYTSTAGGANNVEESTFVPHETWAGLELTTLSSGKVYIYRITT